MATRDVLDWETSISRVVSDGTEEEVIVRGHRRRATVPASFVSIWRSPILLAARPARVHLQRVAVEDHERAAPRAERRPERHGHRQIVRMGGGRRESRRSDLFLRARPGAPREVPRERSVLRHSRIGEGAARGALSTMMSVHTPSIFAPVWTPAFAMRGGLVGREG